MIENRARQHKSVEQRHRHTYRYRRFQLAQHAAGGRTVNVQICILAAVGSWNPKRLPVNAEADMANESFIENAIHRLAVVNRSVRLADHTRMLGWRLGLRHFT